MNRFFKISLTPLLLGVTLLALPFAHSQIPEQELDSIFQRLNGDDYDARYEARMDLQDFITAAGAPGSDGQLAQIEAQLLERLRSESLLTTRLWVLRQLQRVGTEASINTLEGLLTTESRELVDAVKMTLREIAGDANKEEPPELASRTGELLDVCEGAESAAVKAMAFDKIAQKSPRRAAELLKGSPSPGYIRIAATSNKGRLEKAALELLESGDPATQIVVLGALKGRVPSRVERQVAGFLESENETLVLQALEALGRVGTVASLDAILAVSAARSKDLRDAAIDTIASIDDPRLDRSLRAAANRKDPAERAKAIRAMSFRASDGVAELVNRFAADRDLDRELRAEAIAAMEIVGDTDSLPLLVDIVLEEEDSGLRRDAQRTLKRMTLRTADPEAAWDAFKAGFAKADADGKLALMLVADAAPTAEMARYLAAQYDSGDQSVRDRVVRVLPSWRNWDGGEALLAIAKREDSDPRRRSQCFKGIGRIILGSDAHYTIEGKFDLAGAAFAEAESGEEKDAILAGFRYVAWRDRSYVTHNEVAPEIKAAVENGQSKT